MDGSRSVLIWPLFLILLLGGCHGTAPPARPSVTFTKVPPAAQGGRERTDVISGRVSGARPGQQIVVYARSGPWWVQPWPDKQFIPIQADSTWSTATHLGFEYAAMLVDPGYHPAPTLDIAPTPGGAVAAVASVKGTGEIQDAPTKALKFSGYDWVVRTIASDRGGLNNLYSPENAWTDPSGLLHLDIKKRGGRWTCEEMKLTRSLGYGTYIWVARDVTHLEPAAVLSFNTFDDWGGEQHFRELDVELSRWGDAANKNNAQYAIQPFYIPGNLARFTVPAGTFTYVIHWEPGRVTFRTLRGASIKPGLLRGAEVISEHVFTSQVPSAGKEVAEMLFYVVDSAHSPMHKDSEVVIEKFEYLP